MQDNVEGFGALAQTLGRTAIPLTKKYIVPAAKRIGADVFEIAASEIGKVVSGRKKLKSVAEDVGTETVRKQFGEGKRKLPSVELVEPDPFLEKVDRKTVALAKTFLTIQNEYKPKLSFSVGSFYKSFIGDF